MEGVVWVVEALVEQDVHGQGEAPPLWNTTGGAVSTWPRGAATEAGGHEARPIPGSTDLMQEEVL